MIDSPPPEQTPPATTDNPAGEAPHPRAAKILPLHTPTSTPTDELGKPVPVDQLTPAEQMARFEKELKEQDWGHQPC